MRLPILTHSVRADWRRSFDAGCWALVPTMEDLENIIQRLESRKQWQLPYVRPLLYGIIANLLERS